MSAPRKKLTRKRLNNALAQVYREHPNYFRSPPTKLSFFQHVNDGNLDDVQEFLEEADFNINMRDPAGNTALFYAMDGKAGLPMVKLLLDNGADINAMNNIGEVPFHVLCYNLLAVTTSQLEILQYMIVQPNLILFPFEKMSIENIFSYAYNDIQAFQVWYADAIDNQRQKLVERAEQEEGSLSFGGTSVGAVDQIEEAISAENRERAARERVIQEPIYTLYTRIGELSEQYVRYINLVPSNATERSYHYIDVRMTGSQLKQYIQRQIYRNISMNIDILYRGRLLELSQTLGEQGLEAADDETTIRYQVRLVSGVMPRRGGKRKTRRKRN